MNCTKWADPTEVQLTLWRTVDRPVDNKRKTGDGFPPHAPPFQEKSLFLSVLVDALANAVDVLAARVEHLEHQLDQLLAYSDAPLTPDALIARLRELRDGLRGTTK